MTDHRDLPPAVITPPTIIEPDGDGHVPEPPAEPHQHGEPGSPEPAPKRIDRESALSSDVPANVRSLINTRRRVIE